MKSMASQACTELVEAKVGGLNAHSFTNEKHGLPSKVFPA